MKKSDIAIGSTYIAKVSGKLSKVYIDSESLHVGWNATNLETGRSVRVRSAARLRYPAAKVHPVFDAILKSHFPTVA